MSTAATRVRLPPAERPEFVREIAEAATAEIATPLTPWERIARFDAVRQLSLLVLLAAVWQGYAVWQDNPLVLRPWNMPEPLLPIAIQARAKADEDKLGTGLQRLTAEDPTLRIEHNAETHQIVLWCMGEAHADVLLDRLANRYGAAVE